VLKDIYNTMLELCVIILNINRNMTTKSGILESTFPSEKAPTKKQANTASNWLSDSLSTVKAF
jgi:hypothetical protein